MSELKKRIHDESNGLDYVLVGDCYIPVLEVPKEKRPIGRWGRLYKRHLEENKPAVYQSMVLSCTLWKQLADLDEQALERFERIAQQIKVAEGVTEEMKANQQLVWVQKMNSIRNRAEEIVLNELIYN
ncbi:MAG: TnpV protein [Hespellia sp.]|nr:TnpV protein [Hespellia sp.]